MVRFNYLLVNRMQKIFKLSDGYWYFLDKDGDLSDPFKSRRKAITAFTDDNLWELDLCQALDDLFNEQSFYDFPLGGDLF
jgi:hypothetical protein